MTMESIGSLRQQSIDAFWASDSKKRNLLVTEAIELALGIPPGTEPRTNPYDYLNRMANERTTVGDTISLDGKPIIFLGKTTFSGTAEKVSGTFHYRILVPRSVA